MVFPKLRIRCIRSPKKSSLNKKTMNMFHSKTQKLFAPLVIAVLTALLIPVQTMAQHHDILFGHDVDADITRRLDHRDAEYSMTTQEGSIDMLVTRRDIFVQFSDEFMDNLEDEIEDDNDYDEASVLGDILKSMITSGVRGMLDHAVAIPIRDIKEIYYEDGRIYIIDYDDDEIFRDLEIDDVDVMEDFSRRDARRFVASVEKQMH